MLLILLLAVLGAQSVRSIKPTQLFDCTVQDFPLNTPNKDFDGSAQCSTFSTNPVVKKAVMDTLNSQNMIQYNVATDAFDSAASFAEWFHASPNSITLPTSVPLSKVGTLWQYDSMAFYPTSGQGYDKGGTVDSKNYFGSRCSSKFVYKGGETFVWRGNDDMWVFVNGKLMIDAGGIHNAKKTEEAEYTVNMDDFSLTKGCRVDIRLFFADRCSRTGSNFRIQTSMEPVRPSETVGNDCSESSEGELGDGASVVRPEGSTVNESDAAIIKKNEENLLQIGIILGSIFGFFFLWFFILFLVWLCRRDHIKEQRLMHRMGGKSNPKNSSSQSKSVEMSSKKSRGHKREDTYAGWSKMVDPNTGRTYYQNQMTGESRWADELAPDNGLTSVINPQHARTMTQEQKDLNFWGWEEHTDSATGVPFFHNSQTGETSWEKPTK